MTTVRSANNPRQIWIGLLVLLSMLVLGIMLGGNKPDRFDAPVETIVTWRTPPECLGAVEIADRMLLSATQLLGSKERQIAARNEDEFRIALSDSEMFARQMEVLRTRYDTMSQRCKEQK